MLAAVLSALALAPAAQVQALNADLLTHDSATAVLQALCDRRDPAQPRIRARRAEVAEGADAAVRRQLGAGRNEPVRHRRVELLCGEAVYSHADNWYLPSHLTPAMNQALEATETPFGVVVRPLAFRRTTLSVKMLLTPAKPVPADVLRHRAVLRTPEGHAFSLVVETYTKAVIAP